MNNVSGSTEFDVQISDVHWLVKDFNTAIEAEQWLEANKDAYDIYTSIPSETSIIKQEDKFLIFYLEKE